MEEQIFDCTSSGIPHRHCNGRAGRPEDYAINFFGSLYPPQNIILADEPTGNLDSKTSDEVIDLLKETSRKYSQTIVMITHNPEIAEQADRTIRIEDGRIAE